MHRFPNPGSSLDNIIGCFIFLYKNINTNQTFGLRDMQEILVLNGLISSSGRMGSEALSRGANKDLTRDKSYNQCKMYAEIYRVLGWIQSGEKALIYNFTPLGKQLLSTTSTPKRFLEQCCIGILYPNEVIHVSGNHHIRPFVTILKTMNMLGGVLSRDEMIIGPLSMFDDTSDSEFSAMCSKLGGLRQNKSNFDNEIEAMLAARKISRTTAGNYTRFPLGVLRWLEWAEPILDKNNYHAPQKTYRLTERGRTIIKSLESRIDIRLDQVKKIPPAKLNELIKVSFFRMLKASGLDITNCSINVDDLHEYEKQLGGMILFSPYQLLSPDKLFNAFAEKQPKDGRRSTYSPEITEKYLTSEVPSRKVQLTNITTSRTQSQLLKRINELMKLKEKVQVVDELKVEFVSYRKEQYYPLIQDIFSIMGLACDLPPHGVNSRRWDAILLSGDDSIPIEIKSPTEEMHISVKAIRQALENKIILQSRRVHPNKTSTASMAIGYGLPNERADVAELIEDIRKSYDISIVVLGIDVLIGLAIDCVMEDKVIEFNELAGRIGIIDN